MFWCQIFLIKILVPIQFTSLRDSGILAKTFVFDDENIKSCADNIWLFSLTRKKCVAKNLWECLINKNRDNSSVGFCWLFLRCSPFFLLTLSSRRNLKNKTANFLECNTIWLKCVQGQPDSKITNTVEGIYLCRKIPYMGGVNLCCTK